MVCPSIALIFYGFTFRGCVRARGSAHYMLTLCTTFLRIYLRYDIDREHSENFTLFASCQLFLVDLRRERWKDTQSTWRYGTEGPSTRCVGSMSALSGSIRSSSTITEGSSLSQHKGSMRDNAYSMTKIWLCPEAAMWAREHLS